MTIQSFRDLVIWQKGIDLTHEIYSLTKKLPKDERFGLCSQMQRSAVSIPSNIAEGKKRATRKDFSHFLNIALASAAELETQLIIVKDVYPDIDCLNAMRLVIEVQKMITVMYRKLK